ncbi:MAG: LemA family protein [Bacilli bacterium]|nr:LemA family protein [Bacilli bacterium]MBQ6404663.1 LemA family protein [Bacilli bacterium]
METILLIFVIISLLAFIIVIINNKFQLTIIKIDKAEEDIDIYLEKKKELLTRTVPIVKKELKIKEFLGELDKYNNDLNNFEKHNLLKSNYNELFKTLDENEKLLKSDSLVKILEELNDNEENIVGAIKYYNDSVVEFNQLVVSFPCNLIALVRRYKKLEFYNNEKREIFEILNQK